MPFNVEMPDGTIIQDVPDGTTKSQIQAKYQAHLGGGKPAGGGEQPSLMDRAVASPVGRFLHDAIAAPIMDAVSGPLGTAGMIANALPGNGATMAGTPLPQQAKMNPADPLGTAQSYQGTLARNRNTPGYAAARASADKVTASGGGSGFSDQLIAPLLPAAAGTLGMVGGLDTSNAMADAQTDSQKQYSSQHPILSTLAQTAGGFLLAPKMPNVKATVPGQAVPSIGELKTAAGQAYDRVDNAGHVISDTSYDRMVGDLQGKLAGEGIDKTLHPNALAAYNRLAEAKGTPITFKGLDTLRKVAGDAIGASVTNKADQRLGHLVQDHIDDFVEGLKPNDLLGATDPTRTIADLSEARDLWSRASQAGLIQKQIDKAGIKAAGYSQSGMENALRAQFRQLALNDKAMSRLSPEVRDAVKAVAKGGPVGNVLRAVGKYAPHGPVATAAGLGAGALLGGPMGAAEGGLASLAVPMAGELARSGATSMTKAAAKRALDTAALGRAPVVPSAFQAPSLPQGGMLPYGLSLPLLLQTQRQ